jgi:hypothetical protein
MTSSAINEFEKTYKVTSEIINNFLLRTGFLENIANPNKVNTQVSGLIKKTSILERKKNIRQK